MASWHRCAIIANSDWDETFAYADVDYVEAVAQDLGNNAREGVVIIHAETGDILLDETGVVGAGGQQYVGLQDYEVEALKGLPLIFVHNHPNDTGASDEDLRSAYDAGAKLLIVITPSGREQVYIRGRGRMVLVRDEQANYEVGSPTLDETIELTMKSAKQAAAYLDDPAEYVFLQKEQFVELRVNGDLRLYENEEAVLRGDVSAVRTQSAESWGYMVQDQSSSHPYAVEIVSPGGMRYWIDIRGPGAELEFRRVGVASSVYASNPAQVSGQDYDNTSLDFLNALTDALNPQPIGMIKVSGTLRIYTDEEFYRNVDTPLWILSDVDPLVPFSVYEYSELNAHVASIEIDGRKYWIDTSDPDAEFTYIGEIPRYDELEEFVNTGLAELQRRTVENPEIIREYMALLEYIWGYNVEFWDPEFYIGEGKNEEKRSAIEQVFNIARSHYHVTNAFGIEVIRENATSTNYHLGADTKPKTKYHGLVPLEAGSTEAFIGSKMTIGGITHETFHVIDRRFGGRLSVHYRYNRETKTYEGEGGLEWYLRTRVGRLKNDHVLGFNFGMVLGPKTDYVHLNDDSRASDDKWNQEIFPDVAAAVVFGLHEEDFFSKADVYNPDNRIGFANYNSYVKDLICGFHQYFEQVARGVKHPDDFKYSPDECIQ